MENILITPLMLGLVPLVIGLVQLIKGYVSDRFAPILSLILGIGGAFLVPAETVPMTIIGGIVIALMSSGLYSSTRKILE